MPPKLRISLGFVLPLILVCSPSAVQVWGQDSLLRVAAMLPTTEAQVDSLNEWAWNLQGQPEMALVLAEQALALSQAEEYAPGEATAYKRIGTLQRALGHTAEALAANQSALRLLEAAGDQAGVAKVLGNIGNLYLDLMDYPAARRYFAEALHLNAQLGDAVACIHQHDGIGVAYEEEQRFDSALYHYRQSLHLAQTEAEADALQRARAYNNLGTCHYTMQQLDSANWYWTRSHAAFAALGEDGERANLLSNLGLLRQAGGQPRLAIDSFFHPALAIAQATGNAYQRQDILLNIAESYALAQVPDSAYHYLRAYLALHDTLFAQDRSDRIAELETRYQVAQKEALNQRLRAEAQRKTIVIVAVSAFLLLFAVAATYVLRSQRRRHRIQAELAARRQQADALRILELMQTQELRALEALVEGQEQERNRLAGELHDGLGSLLATVKLYFSQIEAQQGSDGQAFQKADHLLDDAVQSLRRYSHDLAGLPVTQFGLLNAVRDLADSITGSGRLQVQVYAHNLEERLPLPIERSLYKVIQELLTNAIKHAQASHISIQLSRHPDHLNLILEDDGRGMDPQAQHSSKGLGLRSVRTRVEALQGEFTVDSRLGRGTTILIDIPLQAHPHA